jgi:NADH-quinone oxidoreductase subunit J
VSGTAANVLVGAVGVVALLGAIAVVVARDVMRLMLGLGSVLLSVAAFFGLLGAGFLAVAEVFVYVGGVLVLFLFAIMLVHRSNAERPVLVTRHDVLAAVIAGGTFLMLVTTLGPAVRRMGFEPMTGSTAELARVLTHSQIAQFEAVGLLLLAALVAAVSILGGEDS